MNSQKLSRGFSYGINDISMTKILEWQKNKEINWKAFLWYIADYASIIGFGDNWLEVSIVSDKQADFFHNKVIKYQPDICENNYEVDIRNELWKSHKKGAERNLSILFKVLK